MDGLSRILTTDDEIEVALDQVVAFEGYPHIVEAIYRSTPDVECLDLRLSDGSRMLIPRENLSELKNATVEQASDFQVGMYGLDIWWPQLDDGFYLPDFLETRWNRVWRGVAA